MSDLQTDLKQLQKKMYREKQRHSYLLEKYDKLQGDSQSTDKSSQLDTSQQEDHDKNEELQTSRSFDEDTMTELTKLQLKMEDVSVSLEKVDAVKQYWIEQVHKYTTIYKYTKIRVGIIVARSIKAVVMYNIAL